MWEDNKKKKRVINFILAFLILVILAALGFVMLRVRKQTAEHDEQLSEMYVQ